MSEPCKYTKDHIARYADQLRWRLGNKFGQAVLVSGSMDGPSATVKTYDKPIAKNFGPKCPVHAGERHMKRVGPCEYTCTQDPRGYKYQLKELLWPAQT